MCIYLSHFLFHFTLFLSFPRRLFPLLLFLFQIIFLCNFRIKKLMQKQINYKFHNCNHAINQIPAFIA